jgi:uncharacterized membrane protein YkvA (DUF1232 family)
LGADFDNSANVVDKCPPVTISWKQQVQRLHTEAHVFYFVFKHPRTHWYTRLVAACTAGYLLSPIQLIPSFIPVIGFLDDLLVFFLGVKLLRKITPPDVLAECRELAEAAEIRRKEEIRSAAAVVPVAVAALWLLAAVTASALMAAYIRHQKEELKPSDADLSVLQVATGVQTETAGTIRAGCILRS